MRKNDGLKYFFEKFKIPTIDTDVLARQAVTKGSEGLKEVVSHLVQIF